MSFPAPEDALRLHERLLVGDVLAGPEAAEAFLEPLTCRLEFIFPGTDPHLIAEAAETALLDYLESPDKYDRQRSALSTYLMMLARGDLANLQKREGRRQRRREIVELDSLAGNTVRSQEPPLLRLVREEEDAAMRAVVEEVDADATPDERAVLRLMTEGEKATGPYAEVLGIADQPADEQQDEVKREKDKIKKRLTRRYKRHG